MSRISVKRIVRNEGWIRQEWSQRIREARDAAGITQAKMAKATGLSQPTISAIEGEREMTRPITSRQVELICEVLGMEPVDLLYPDRGEAQISKLGQDLLACVEGAEDLELAALDAYQILRPYLGQLARRSTKSEGP